MPWWQYETGEIQVFKPRKQWQAEDVADIFPTATSLEWFLRASDHCRELVEADVMLRTGGRRGDLFGDGAREVVLEIFKRESLERIGEAA